MFTDQEWKNIMTETEHENVRLVNSFDESKSQKHVSMEFCLNQL